MHNDFYPKGTVRALLQSDLMTEPTHRVLKGRLEQKNIVSPLFFDNTLFITLKAVCDRLIPQPLQEQSIDLAGILDQQMAEGKGNGWRYDIMPPDDEAYKKGLAGINETSTLMFGSQFHLLESAAQDQVLHSVQSGTAPGNTWQTIPAPFFFEELLAFLVEIYYSHPLAKEEIGDVSMADAKGWQKIGLNELEKQEPEPSNKGQNGNESF